MARKAWAFSVRALRLQLSGLSTAQTRDLSDLPTTAVYRSPHHLVSEALESLEGEPMRGQKITAVWTFWSLKHLSPACDFLQVLTLASRLQGALLVKGLHANDALAAPELHTCYDAMHPRLA